MHPQLSTPIKLALMDRSPLTLTGLSSFLSTFGEENDILVQKTTMASIYEELPYHPVDILITELNGQNELPSQGQKLLLNLCAQLPELRAIVYTRSQKSEDFDQLLDIPGISIISRRDDLMLVRQYVKQIFNGDRIISPTITNYLNQNDSMAAKNLHNLTRCENDVLNFLFSGMSLQEIAERKNRSIKTISAHKCNIMRKLQVKNDSELFAISRTPHQ